MKENYTKKPNAPKVIKEKPYTDIINITFRTNGKNVTIHTKKARSMKMSEMIFYIEQYLDTLKKGNY